MAMISNPAQTAAPDIAPSDCLTDMDRLSSRFALQDLVSDYCLGVDQRELDRFLAIWWEDAVWDIEFVGTFSGHEGISRGLHDVISMIWQSTAHYCVNLRVHFGGPDKALGISNVYCIGNLADGQAANAIGTYHDYFERRCGVWKILRRRVNQRFFTPLTGISLTPPHAVTGPARTSSHLRR
jgi:ketosteroid isomerase-like protein